MAGTPITPPLSPDEALAAEYALGTLPSDERVAFEVRLRDEPALRVLVAAWNEHLLPMANDFEPEQPPASVYKAIEGRLFEPEATAKSAGWLDSLVLWRGLAGIGVAAALVLGVMIYQQRDLQPGPQTAFFSQIQSDDNGLSVSVFHDEVANHLVLTRHAGTPATGRDFELWFIVPDTPPLSLGTLSPGDRIEIALPSDLVDQIGSGVSLAISDEPTGGSPTGQPTGDVLAVGQVIELKI